MSSSTIAKITKTDYFFIEGRYTVTWFILSMLINKYQYPGVHVVVFDKGDWLFSDFFSSYLSDILYFQIHSNSAADTEGGGQEYFLTPLF